MTTPLVAPSVCRFSVNGHVGDRPMTNVLDFVISGLTAEDRTTAISDTAASILDSWANVIVDRSTHEYVFESLSWVDLDSADGETGTLFATDDHTLPITGGRGGETCPFNASILVTKQASSGRGKRNGRMFLPPPTEDAQNNGLLTDTYLATIQAGVDQFLSDTTDTAIGAAHQQFLCVVHTKNVGTPTAPVIEYEGNSQVHHLVTDQLLATQRRRLRK